MINYVKYTLIKDVKIAVIGANGRCGNGVRFILDYFKLEYIMIDRNYDIQKLIEFDIIYNCILLDESYDKVWFDKETKFEKNLVISDISCDYSSKNNPIQLYNKSTNWIEPIYKYNQYVDIIIKQIEYNRTLNVMIEELKRQNLESQNRATVLEYKVRSN